MEAFGRWDKILVGPRLGDKLDKEAGSEAS